MELVRKEFTYFYIDEIIPLKPKKTKVFHVYNKNTHARLGYIQWYPAWRQYCFFPDPQTLWSKGCMTELNQFLTEIKDLRNG